MQHDFYEGYNADRYIHYRLIPTGKFEIINTVRNGKELPLRREIFEKRILQFDEIKELNLDNNGLDVRTSGDDFTLIHNYLLDFWGAIIGSEALALYSHLKRYCFGPKDFCFPNMDVIAAKMKKTRNTVVKYLDILEEYGFILKINRLDKERNNGDSSPFFKIRRYIPLLSLELIEVLPDFLKVEHDKFLAKCNGIELNEKISSYELVEDLIKNGETIKTKKNSKKLEQLKMEQNYREYLLKIMKPDDVQLWAEFLRAIEKKVSKPSFETWFQHSLLFMDRNHNSKIHLVFQNNFAKEHTEQRLQSLLRETLNSNFNVENDNELEINFITYEVAVELFEKNTD